MLPRAPARDGAEFPNALRPCTLRRMALLRGDGLAAVLGAAAQAPAAAGDLAHRILQDPAYQRSLPADAPPPDLPGAPPWDLRLLFTILLYAALAVVLALAVAWLVRQLGPGRARDAEVAPEGGPAPLQVPLEGPERLAAAGRYAEAIHALLLETLAALSRAARLAPSFTSREILARVGLPDPAREALAGLVLAVEVSRFGGVPAAARDYEVCLDRFHDFLASYGGPVRPAGEAAP